MASCSRAARALVLVSALAGVSCASSCGSKTAPTDLLELEGTLIEGSVAGRDMAWIKGQTGKHLRINDVVRRVLPAVSYTHLTLPTKA